MIAIVIATVASLAEEVIMMTPVEVEAEVTSTAVAEEEEDAEGVGWVVEDLTSLWEEVEAEREGVEDFTMIEEEAEKLVDQTLVVEVEVEVGIDENHFEGWMTCRHAIVKEIDHAIYHREEMDPEICLAMDRSEKALEINHEEKKCSETALGIYREEMKCTETALEISREETKCKETALESYREEKKPSEILPETYHGEMNPSEMDREKHLEEMSPVTFPTESHLIEMDPENFYVETVTATFTEMNREGITRENCFATMGQTEMVQETFRKEMDPEICYGMVQGTSREMVFEMILETSFDEMNITGKTPEIFHVETNP
jgi:hypothetical protein